MRKPLNVVIDTNIFVSALLGGRACAQIVHYFKKRVFTLVISEVIIREIEAVLTTKDLGSITTVDVERLLQTIYNQCFYIKPEKTIDMCRDPADNKILEAAVSANAQFIVTGDKDLLVLDSIGKTSIVTPKEFINYLKAHLS